jgi:flagellar protein FliO/FliZ
MFGLDLSTAQKVMVASVVILILLVLLGLFVRQIQGGGLKLKGQSGGRARQPRLGVVDAHNLDRQRQLILIRRDNVEHLIMIGGASDVVVETNIVRAGARTATQPVEYAQAERQQSFDALVPQEALRHEAPRPEALRQETLRQETAPQATARQEFVVQEEAVRVEPVAVVQPRAEQLPPLPPKSPAIVPPSRPVQSMTQADAALAAAAVAVPAAMAAASTTSSSFAPNPVPTPSVTPPSFTRDHTPSPSASALELDNMARQLEEALKRPFSAVRPATASTEPSVTVQPAASPEPAPMVAPEPISVVTPEPAPEPSFAAATEPVEPIQDAAPAAPAIRNLTLPPDVEAELEMALGLRPSRATTAAPVEAVEPVADTHEPLFDTQPEREDEPFDSEPTFVEPVTTIDDADEPEGIEAGSKPEAEPETAEPQADETEAAEAEVKAAEETTAKAEEPKPAAIDPFSVDAIEAEFARLLGRDPKPKA